MTDYGKNRKATLSFQGNKLTEYLSIFEEEEEENRRFLI